MLALRIVVKCQISFKFIKKIRNWKCWITIFITNKYSSRFGATKVVNNRVFCWCSEVVIFEFLSLKWMLQTVSMWECPLSKMILLKDAKNCFRISWKSESSLATPWHLISVTILTIVVSWALEGITSKCDRLCCRFTVGGDVKYLNSALELVRAERNTLTISYEDVERHNMQLATTIQEEYYRLTFMWFLLSSLSWHLGLASVLRFYMSVTNHRS